MDVAMVNRMLGFHRGGGEIWDLKMAEHLVNLGMEVTFYIGEPIISDIKNPPTAFPHVTIPTPHLRDTAYRAPPGVGGLLSDVDMYAFAHRSAKILRENDHDIIHVNANPAFSRYCSQFEQPVTTKLNGPPYSLIHDRLLPMGSTIGLLSDFDCVIATGSSVNTVKSINSPMTKIINPGVETSMFTPKGTHSEEPYQLLFVGRFVPAKNISLLIKAVSEIRKRGWDITLTLIGDGPLADRLKNQTRELGVQDIVHFLGYIQNDKLPDYYSMADMFVLPSRQENHPITLLEAMSSGLPVVAPRIGWIPNIVDHEENGLLYEPTSCDELIDDILSLLTDNKKMGEYGKSGREKAVEGFDWEQRARKLQQVFMDVANRTDVRN